jgi:hypothetical protein
MKAWCLAVQPSVVQGFFCVLFMTQKTLAYNTKKARPFGFINVPAWLSLQALRQQIADGAGIQCLD